jgi:hypothetical protein
MRNAHSLSAKVAAHRPPGAPAREAAVIGEIAQRWRDELARVLTEIDAELEYLLRRFKGFYYRRRYQNISLLGAA